MLKAKNLQGWIMKDKVAINVSISYYEVLQQTVENSGTERKGMPHFPKVNKYHMEEKKTLCHKK